MGDRYGGGVSAPTGAGGTGIRVRRSRRGVLILFLLLGVVGGNFASRLPALKASLDLSAGRLGLLLLGPALGCVLSTPTSGWVLQRLAPRRWIFVGLVPECAALPLVALTRSPWLALVGLLLWGWGTGTVDVSMNTEATRVQAQLGRRILSGFHATYSIGALAGAGVGALAALGGVTPGWQWAGAGALCWVAGVYAASLTPKTVVTSVRPAGTDLGTEAGPQSARADRAAAGGGVGRESARVDGESARADGAAARADGASAPADWPADGRDPAPVGAESTAGRRPGSSSTRALVRGRNGLPLALVALAVICFASLLSEGAATDWSAVYMRTALGTTPALATLAYAGFEATMVVGRLSGDRLAMRWGPVRLLRAASLLGALGLGAGLAAADPAVAVVGFALLGVGLSVSFPLAITSAAALGRAGPSVAIVTSCGYVGLLAGPPLLGGLATALGLPAALTLLVALCLVLAALAGALRRGGGPGDRQARPAAEPVDALR